MSIYITATGLRRTAEDISVEITFDATDAVEDVEDRDDIGACADAAADAIRRALANLDISLNDYELIEVPNTIYPYVRIECHPGTIVFEWDDESDSYEIDDLITNLHRLADRIGGDDGCLIAQAIGRIEHLMGQHPARTGLTVAQIEAAQAQIEANIREHLRGMPDYPNTWFSSNNHWLFDLENVGEVELSSHVTTTCRPVIIKLDP